MKTKFRKGQKVVCTHYKKKYLCTIISVDEDTVWVNEIPSNGIRGAWWGPKSWFKPLKRKVK